MSNDLNGLILFKNLIKELREGNNIFTIEFPMDSESTLKAESLKKQGRDFFAVNRVMEMRIAEAMQKRLTTNPEIITEKDGVETLLEVGAEAVKDLIVERFESGGGDVSVKPLKQSTIKEKGSSKVGVDSGSLLTQVRKVKPKVRR